MSDRYDFGNLSPIEFESLCVDLMAAEIELRFERFSEGADGGVDGRHSKVNGDIILQAKHYKNSTWSDLQKAVKDENKNIVKLNPSEYYLLTSQPLTRFRKDILRSYLDHPSVIVSNILGRSELNALLAKHPDVEKRNIKLWLSSTAVLDRLLNNDIAIFTEATHDEIQRILKVFVVNPSLKKSAEILEDTHCLIVSGPPGVGKTTLAQVLAAEYCDEGWELVSITSIDDGFRALRKGERQVFIFDDFLGKIKLDPTSLAKDDGKIVKFLSAASRDKTKRFILTTRSYILQAARTLSEALDDKQVEISEMVLNISTYTRELKARILYNHLYHSEIDQAAIQALLAGDTVKLIVDHRNYMPRIIQWMTDEIRHQDVPASEYPKLFLHTLDHPNKIWDKAFKHHISSKAQILLYCLYFSKFDGFPAPGVRLEKLQPFFERAIVGFGIVAEEELRATMFDETLREVKSSFLVIEGERANFINPSVQDYLSREIVDPTVLSVLGRSIPSIAVAGALWKKVEQRLAGKARVRVANALLKSVLSGDIDGTLPLDELADLIGDLILATGDNSYCQTLRRQGDKLFWTRTSKLPRLIEALVEGKYRDLPYARAYARYLRRQVFHYVSEREYAIELEELAEMAANLSRSGIEMSEEFGRHFDEAVEEAVDAVDTNRAGFDEESINEWLECIDKIESISPTAAGWKKRDLEERLGAIRRETDLKERWEEEQNPRPRTQSSLFESRPGAGGSFSNADLQSMFSSLKRSD